MESPRILIVDDEPVICSGCQMALSGENYAVDTCLSGQSGLDAILKGDYDVVLLDLRLPDLGGMEILKTAGRQRPDIHVIVMTGHFSVENAVDAMKSGAFDYLTKPFSDDELCLAVAKAVESKRLREENRSLRRQLAEQYEFRNIVGKNPQILKIFEGIEKVAPTDSTVLLYGESGTGKELFARAIHGRSKRAAKGFFPFDCCTFSSSLLESELFGHVKGAFTGALEYKPGIFEMACGGTLFLDEIANLSMETQSKLLRTLETHEYKPVGGNQVKESNVRIIGATNRDLKVMVENGEFREDLFYRLNVFPVFIPPLRDRKDDIPRLLYHFLQMYTDRIEKRIDGFSDEALAFLMENKWPGNVRQLKNVVERLVIMADEHVVSCENLTQHLEMWENRTSDAVPETLDQLKAVKRHLLEHQFGLIERAFLQKALSRAQGNITRASTQVGMQRSNFSALMKKHAVSGNAIKPSQKGG